MTSRSSVISNLLQRKLRKYEDDKNLSDEDRKMSKISVFRDVLFVAQETVICVKHLGKLSA